MPDTIIPIPPITAAPKVNIAAAAPAITFLKPVKAA